MTGRLQELIEEFKTMGASLEEAIKFAREQMVIERDDRARQRELDLLEKEKLAEIEQNRMRLQHEQEMDKARLDQQRILSESDSQVRLHEIDSRARMAETSVRDRSIDENRFHKYDLGLGKFSNNVDDLESFITRFETVAKAYNLPDSLYAIEFSKCLSGESLVVYETLSMESRLNYEDIVDAVKRKFGVTLTACRKRFLNAKCGENELQQDFVVRLKKYYLNWLAKAEYEESFKDILEHIVLDRYFQSQTQDLKTYLREQGRLKMHEMICKAQNYIDAHDFRDNKSNHGQKDRRYEPSKRFDHKRQEFKTHENKTQSDSSQSSASSKAQYKNETQVKKTEFTRRSLTCFTCGKPGHKSIDCYHKKKTEDKKTGKESAACMLANPQKAKAQDNSVEIAVEGDHEKSHNKKSWPIVAVAEEFDEVYLQDLKYPFRGKAKVGSSSVRFLRDTGSSVSIVKQVYVKPHEYVDQETTVLLADRCVRQLPNAVVQVRIPGYEGPLKVCVMADPVSDFVIGNDIYSSKNDIGDQVSEMSDEDNEMQNETLVFENQSVQKPLVALPLKSVESSQNVTDQVSAKDKQVSVISFEMEDGMSIVIGDIVSFDEGRVNDNVSMGEDEVVIPSTDLVNECSNKASKVDTNAAVQTRDQVRKETTKRRPLKVTVIDELNITSDEFRVLQENDEKLQKYWELARDPPSGEKPSQYLIKQGLLYRKYQQNPHIEAVTQLVVPSCLEQKVISYAHDTTLSGHGSIASTYRKLSREFHILGASGKCRDYVKSCLLCQKGANRSVGGKAPLMKMPQVTEPFHTVYVDLVGEIHPPSTEGHKYILCATDACTHFPIAVPLKKTDSVSIAEALLSQFNIFGHPHRIINDNAANLTSDILKEIYRVYGMEIKTIPVYRPESNSIQERSHAVIKGILKKLCVEQPRQWHRYIDPLLFAIRTTENTNGFTPFELLYGRLPHTHMSVLKDLWTGQDNDPVTKTTYQYVLDLRNRIEETCLLAQEQIAKTHLRNVQRLNKYAKLRILSPGDKVLVLSPKPKNKLDFIWKGPAEVIERRGVVNYRIKFDSGTERTYHINMLKKFVSRQTDETNQSVRQDGKSEKTDCETRADIDDENNSDENEISAAVMGLVECSDEENEDQLPCKSETSQMQLYNMHQTETWRDVQINPELSEEEQEKFRQLLIEFQDIFSDVPTQTHLITHKIKLKHDDPIHCKPYKIPVHMMDRVEKELDLMLKQGIIERSDSDYASPMVIVKKKNTDELRICVDFSRLNAISVVDPMPQAEPEDILAKLGNAQIFSTFDACKGFYAIPMDPDSKNYASFITPRDCYRFNSMPFGLSGAPASYSRMTRMMLRGAKNLDNFVDDIIAHTKNDFDEHILALRELFTRVRNANIKLRPTKSRVGYREIQFLGFKVSKGQIRPTQESIEKILNSPIPRTKKGVRSLCGCINWLRRYIPKAAKLLKPLSDLTLKTASEVVKWGAAQNEALQEVKTILTTQPVLSLYDVSKEHVLQTDASSDYIGGVLLQREEDGELHPIMYASRKCVDREIRYDIQNKEMMAIVWCCRRFYKYLYGSHFVIQTDCQALTILNGKLSNNARVVRWQLEMQAYDFKVEIIKGKDNGCADYLTRMGT